MTGWELWACQKRMDGSTVTGPKKLDLSNKNNLSVLEIGTENHFCTRPL